jgi:acyl-CoA thioesterase FadM
MLTLEYYFKHLAKLQAVLASSPDLLEEVMVAEFSADFINEKNERCYVSRQHVAFNKTFRLDAHSQIECYLIEVYKAKTITKVTIHRDAKGKGTHEHTSKD